MYRLCYYSWPPVCALGEVRGSIAGSSEGSNVCCYIVGLSCCNWSPVITHTHHTIPIWRSGLDQIHCAFCLRRTGLKARAVYKPWDCIRILSVFNGPPLWSTGQSSWLQIQRSWVRFPALPDFLRNSGSGTGSTQPREDNWGATWMKK
jgi:hypothetical protein